MKSEDLVANVVSAAVGELRQIAFVPFWKSSIKVTPWGEVRELFDTSRMKEGRARKLLEDTFAQLDFQSFRLEVRDDKINPGELRPSVHAVLRDGHEWIEVFGDAWEGAESPNEWCLSDNAVRLVKWLQGPKNSAEFIPQNRIGAQAGLRGTSSRRRIETYFGEINFKSPYEVIFERQGGYNPLFKARLSVKEEREEKQREFENPIFAGELVNAKPPSLEAYARLMEDRVLSADCSETGSCILFAIHSHQELLRALPNLRAHENVSPYQIKEFLGRVRLARGLKVAATLSDHAGEGWHLGAVHEDGWSWDRIRESIQQKRSRKDPRSAYGLSDRSAKVLEWIWNLHDDEIGQGLTPCVEAAAAEQIGIDGLEYEQNSGTLLEVLIEEINEKTPISLRLLPWLSYSRSHHRLLVKERDAKADLFRRIQLQGLERGVALTTEKIAEFLTLLWGDQKQPR